MVVNRKIYNIPRIACPKYGFDQLIDADRCKDCAWYESTDEKSETVQCLYDRGILMHNMHVTEFNSRDYTYKAVQLANMSDEEYERRIIEQVGEERYQKKDFDTCDLCCFKQILKNGETLCLLRQSAVSEEISSFCCYEDEIWEQYPKETEKENKD